MTTDEALSFLDAIQPWQMHLFSAAEREAIRLAIKALRKQSQPQQQDVERYADNVRPK